VSLKSLKQARTAELLVAGHRLMEAAQFANTRGYGYHARSALCVAAYDYKTAEDDLVALINKKPHKPARPFHYCTANLAEELAPCACGVSCHRVSSTDDPERVTCASCLNTLRQRAAIAAIKRGTR
jgi:hypothetical protein